MKRILLPLLFLLGSSLSLRAQIETPADSIGRPLPQIPDGEILRPLPPQQQAGEFDASLPALSDDLKKDTITFRFTPPEYISYPWVTPPQGMTKNPYAWDYNRSDFFRLNPTSAIQTHTFHQTYPTMGTHVQAGATYIYSPSDSPFTFSGGMYVAKYSMPSLMQSVYNDTGIHAAIHYQINDRLTVKGFGQYSLRGQSNSHRGLMPPMYPQTHFGGTMELKINDTWGVEGGIMREYDPIKMKWVNTPIFGPVFYGKKKK